MNYLNKKNITKILVFLEKPLQHHFYENNWSFKIFGVEIFSRPERYWSAKSYHLSIPIDKFDDFRVFEKEKNKGLWYKPYIIIRMNDMSSEYIYFENKDELDAWLLMNFKIDEHFIHYT